MTEIIKLLPILAIAISMNIGSTPREDKSVDSKQYAVPINRYAIILALKMPEINFFQLNESSFVPML